MHQAYKKECQLTLIAFLVTTVLTHFYLFYFMFPAMTKSMLFGFPTHYLLSMVVGWIILMPLYWIYIQMSEKIDREIEEAESSGDDAAHPTTAAER